MDGTLPFYTAFAEAKASAQGDTVSRPPWKNLSALRAGRTYGVSDDSHLVGTGILAADLALDALAKTFE